MFILDSPSTCTIRNQWDPVAIVVANDRKSGILFVSGELLSRLAGDLNDVSRPVSDTVCPNTAPDGNGWTIDLWK